MLNTEAENAVLGCLLLEGDLAKETVLQPKHFSVSSNKLLFEQIKKLEKNNEQTDVVTIVTSIDQKTLDKIGGRKRLSDLANSIPSTELFKTFEKRVLELYQIRRAREIQSQEINSIDDIIKINRQLEEIEMLDDSDDYDHQKALVSLYDKIENQKPGLSGYDTGFKDLNRYLDGFQEGNLIITAARPSMGKTALMLNHAIKHEGVVAIFSLEMSSESLNRRMLSTIGRINGHKMRNPNQYFNEKDWSDFNNAIGILSKKNIYIYDRSGQTVSYIRSKVRALRKKYPNENLLVMIDYLQLMRTEKEYQNKNIEVGEITRSLKELARDEKVPVYLLSQLSRAVEQRQNKRPIMSDIRDSGSVEQDADVIMFLHRDDYYNREDQNNIMEIIIAKQRDGEVGVVELVYKRDKNLFLDMERVHEHQRTL